MTNRTGASSDSLWRTLENRVEQAGLVQFGLGVCVHQLGRAERRHESRQLWSGGAKHRLELLGIKRPSESSQRLDDGTVRDPAVTDVGASALEHTHPATDGYLGRGKDQS